MWQLSRFVMGLVISQSLTCAIFAGQDDGRLDIYWVDVEGGAATLIVTPQGESILIDAGNPGRRDADRIFQAATRDAGLRKIDHLITTHYHGDHYGGAAMLATTLPIGHVHDNGLFESLREKPPQEYLTFAAERRSVISPGDKLDLRPGATPLALRCLAARQQTIAPASSAAAENACCSEAVAKPIDNSDNANSVVMLLEFGPFRFFDAGDLTWNIEQKLACPHDLVGPVDVYQVTHHGLDNSNNPVLVKTLAPTVAVMNNGTTKGCGQYTFATLQETKSVQAVYQMHRNLRPDGETNNAPAEQIANREQDCAANTIKLSVAADGKSYLVSIPATGHTRTFATRP